MRKRIYIVTNQIRALRVVFFLVLFGLYIYFIPPEHVASYLLFYGLLYSIFVSALRIIVSRNQAIVYSLLGLMVVFLRQFKIDTSVNLLILLGLFLVSVYYFRKL